MIHGPQEPMDDPTDLGKDASSIPAHEATSNCRVGSLGPYVCRSLAAPFAPEAPTMESEDSTELPGTSGTTSASSSPPKDAARCARSLRLRVCVSVAPPLWGLTGASDADAEVERDARQSDSLLHSPLMIS